MIIFYDELNGLNRPGKTEVNFDKSIPALNIRIPGDIMGIPSARTRGYDMLNSFMHENRKTTTTTVAESCAMKKHLFNMFEDLKISSVMSSVKGIALPNNIMKSIMYH